MKRPEVHVVEAGQRLSHSLIWRLQRRFYAQRGLAAFSQGTVPHYITSNPFIAAAYASVVLGYLRDLAPRLRPGQPVYLIEIGAGSGRFGFLFLKKLSELLAESPLHGVRFCYVLTDFSPASVAAWQAHPALQPFVAAQRLDFAVFDATAPGALTLQHSGAVLSPATLENPIVVLANYVLDGIAHDAFRLQDGQLYESLVTLTSFQPEPDLEAPGLLDRLDVLYEQRPLADPRDYYADPACNRLLATYARGPEEGVLLFPCAALACLAYLRQLSGDRLLLLTGDKGDPTADARLPQSAPELTHHGSVSLMLNHHALGEYVRQAGGQVFTTGHRHAHLNVSAFVLGTEPADHAETRHAYKGAVQRFGPDDYYLVKKSLDGHLDALALDQILALLRLGGFDAAIVAGCYAALLRCLPQASAPWQHEARQALAAVWQTYYHIGEKWDLPFHLGTLLVAMGCHREAAQRFRDSLSLYGPTRSTLDSLARCHDCLGESEAAQRCRVEAQQLAT